MTTTQLLSTIETARTLGLTTLYHLAALAHLEKVRSCTLTDLCKQLGFSTASATDLADHFETLHYAKRRYRVPGQDRRLIWLDITKTGSAAIQTILN